MDEKIVQKNDTFAATFFTMNDKTKIDLIFSTYYNMLCFFAKRIVGNKEDAEDIVGDIFLKLAENPELSHIKSLKLYLYKAVHNKCLKYLKHIQVLKKYAQEVDLFLPYDEKDPLSNLISEETACEIQQAIDSLPPKCKMIFVLVKLEGLTYLEVAKILDVSVSTVHSQITIAMNKLRKSLRENRL